jgi:hypothetical protein
MGCGVVQTKSGNASRSARPCPEGVAEGQDPLIYTTQLDINYTWGTGSGITGN